LRVRPFTWRELSPWHRAFAQAAGDDAILHPANIVDGVRWSTAFAYLDPVRDALTVRPETLVDRVLLSGDRAVGVATSAGELRGQHVVLAAGAYGSPAILLRSGLGPPVGEGLIDHVGVGFGYEPSAPLVKDAAAFERDRPLYMAQVTVEARSSACDDGVCDLFLFPAIEALGSGTYDISAAVFAMKPASRGSVRLRSPDPREPLAIDHGFLSDERDVAVLAEGVEALRALAASRAVATYVAREVRPGPEVDPIAHVRAAARGFFHPVGTCAIGHVVDGDGRVRGIDGLTVADASIIPSIPRANTNLTVVAVAERLAERLAQA
jgi:choline dehydrogenase